jgi:hypothetical protein
MREAFRGRDVQKQNENAEKRVKEEKGISKRKSRGKKKVEY